MSFANKGYSKEDTSQVAEVFRAADKVLMEGIEETKKGLDYLRNADNLDGTKVQNIHENVDEVLKLVEQIEAVFSVSIKFIGKQMEAMGESFNKSDRSQEQAKEQLTAIINNAKQVSGKAAN